MALQFTNPETAASFEFAYPDLQPEQRITLMKHYSGPISGITPSAAEIYVKQGGNLIVRKAAAKATPSPKKEAAVLEDK